jgi:hypothetical protein
MTAILTTTKKPTRCIRLAHLIETIVHPPEGNVVTLKRS